MASEQLAELRLSSSSDDYNECDGVYFPSVPSYENPFDDLVFVQIKKHRRIIKSG